MQSSLLDKNARRSNDANSVILKITDAGAADLTYIYLLAFAIIKLFNSDRGRLLQETSISKVF